MKKRVLKVASLLLVGAVVTIFSCTKENDMMNPQKVEDSGLSLKDLKINNLILDFKEDLAYYKKNSSIKDGESKSVDSAVWLLESTLNYSHSFPAESYSEFEVDEVTLTVSKDASGEVLMTELAQKYDELKSKVSANYHDSEYTEKGLNGIILTKESESNNEVILSADIYTGKKGTDPNPNPVLDGPFEEEDNWWYGENAGQCDAPGLKASDAAEELRVELAAAIPDPGGNYFFINPVLYPISGGNTIIQVDDTPDNYLDYYLYFSSTEVGDCTDEVLCVDWTEMNNYYQKGKYMMFTLLPQVEPELLGKTVDELVEMNDIFDFDFNTGITKYKHEIVLKYGDKVGQNFDPTEIE